VVVPNRKSPTGPRVFAQGIDVNMADEAMKTSTRTCWQGLPGGYAQILVAYSLATTPLRKTAKPSRNFSSAKSAMVAIEGQEQKKDSGGSPEQFRRNQGTERKRDAIQGDTALAFQDQRDAGHQTPSQDQVKTKSRVFQDQRGTQHDVNDKTSSNESNKQASKALSQKHDDATSKGSAAATIPRHCQDYFLFGLEIGAVIEKSDSLQPTSNQVRKRSELHQFDSCLLL
jgi:hypothetical protein